MKRSSKHARMRVIALERALEAYAFGLSEEARVEVTDLSDAIADARQKWSQDIEDQDKDKINNSVSRETLLDALNRR